MAFLRQCIVFLVLACLVTLVAFKAWRLLFPAAAAAAPPVGISEHVDCATYSHGALVGDKLVLLFEDRTARPSHEHLAAIEEPACLAVRGAAAISPPNAVYLASLPFRVYGSVHGISNQAEYREEEGEVSIGVGILELRPSSLSLVWMFGHELGHATVRKGFTLGSFREAWLISLMGVLIAVAAILFRKARLSALLELLLLLALAVAGLAAVLEVICGSGAKSKQLEIDADSFGIAALVYGGVPLFQAQNAAVAILDAHTQLEECSCSWMKSPHPSSVQREESIRSLTE